MIILDSSRLKIDTLNEALDASAKALEEYKPKEPQADKEIEPTTEKKEHNKEIVIENNAIKSANNVLERDILIIQLTPKRTLRNYE